MSHYFRKITLLAGGVGGAKIAEGFDSISEIDLSIIGNVADDDFFHGLWVSPDIDTITYSLAKIINRDQGWGLSEESFNSLNMLKQFNQETWMTLGDKDFGTHIYRTITCFFLLRIEFNFFFKRNLFVLILNPINLMPLENIISIFDFI